MFKKVKTKIKWGSLPTEVKDLFKGLQHFLTRSLAQIAVKEDLNIVLKDPVNVAEIAKEKGYTDLGILDYYLRTLAILGVLEEPEPHKFVWKGHDLRISTFERLFLEKSTPFAPKLSEYAEFLPKALKGARIRREEGFLAIMDAIYSSQFYTTLIGAALEKAQELPNNTIFDLYGYTGWGSITMADTFQEIEQIFFVEPDAQSLAVAKENLSNLGITDEVNIEFVETNPWEELPKTKAGLVFGLELFQRTDPEDYENLLKLCFESLEEEGKFIAIQPSRLEPHEPFSYEVLLLVKQDFRGFPSQESLLQQLEKAGFENIAILENFVILAEKPSK